MHLAHIERSRVDRSWCITGKTVETLCPWWLVPVVWLYACFN